MSACRHRARFLGLDLGTSSLKALAAGANGEVLGVASRRYTMLRPHAGWAEQDPAHWWAALSVALDDLRAAGISLDALDGIGLAGQMHGLVLLNARGEPLGPCQTWADSRCEREARAFERRVGRERLLQLAGSYAYTSATAPKLLWTRRHDPERLRAATHMLLPKDELRFRLTGTLATDASDASGTLLCDVAARGWSAELVAAAEVQPGLLPPVVEATTVVGAVTEMAARALGLPSGVPVVAGGGDAAGAAVGHGLLGGAADSGVGLAMLGTAGQLLAATPEPRTAAGDALQTLCHAVPGRWLVMHAILAGGSALDWLASVMAPGVSESHRAETLGTLLAGAADEPPGAQGVLFLPHLNGERTPRMEPEAAGAFIGLGPETTAAQLARAVIEGVALALREGLDAMRAIGIGVGRVRLAGGANRCTPWPEVQASVYGLPVERSHIDDASALGAARLAAVGVAALTLDDLATTSTHGSATDGAVTLPIAAETAIYQRLFRLHRSAQRQLRGTFRALGRR